MSNMVLPVPLGILVALISPTTCSVFWGSSVPNPNLALLALNTKLSILTLA